MPTGTAKKKGGKKGKRILSLTPKRVVDFLLKVAGSKDMSSSLQSRHALYCTATNAALELGASQSKIDSLMRFYANGLANPINRISSFLNQIEKLGPKASRKDREAAVRGILKVGAYRYACCFAREYLGRGLTQEEFRIALEIYCHSGMYNKEDDRELIDLAAKFSRELADEVAAKLKARIKIIGYSS